MTQYRLKNTELQKKLDELGDDFSARLNEAVQLCYDDAQKTVDRGGLGIIPVSFGGAYENRYGDQFVRFVMRVPFNDIEEVDPFDPKKWNSWPEVDPPEGIDMCLEYRDSDGELHREVALFNYCIGKWENTDGGYEIDIDKGRFRPWDEEDLA